MSHGEHSLTDRLRRKAVDRRTPIFYAGLFTEAYDEIVELRRIIAANECVPNTPEGDG
jgi:hypothetical protein